MNQFLLYNGEWITEDLPLITANNRGFRYGDGLFETIKVTGGHIHLAEYHFERLFSGLQLLQFNIDALFTPEYLSQQIISLCNKNGYADARVRLTVFRSDGGLYDIENNALNYIIQSTALNMSTIKDRLVIGLYPYAQKNMDAFANYKTNNYLSSAMAAIYAKQHGWGDALLLNAAGRICDASIANVFIVKNKSIYTAPLSEGCVAGVMRRHLLKTLPEKGFSISEKNISIDDIQQADEIFLTNAIQGIRSVKQCGEKTYGHELTNTITI